MAKVSRFNGFNIFTPDQQESAESRQRGEYAELRNREFLDKFTIPEKPPIPISGTFIYAHAPDYGGCVTLDWHQEEWEKLFAGFQEKNLDTAIFQAAVWKELEECYYPSKYFGNFRCWQVIPEMLKAAEKYGIKVYLGGYGSTTGWDPGFNRETAEKEFAAQSGCLQELSRYADDFAGIYLAPETAFFGNAPGEREKHLNYLYRKYFTWINENLPGKEIIISPCSKYYPDSAEKFVNFWDTVWQDVENAILAPQDSVGSRCCTLPDQPEMWDCWKIVAQHHRMKLWADIELFARIGGIDPDSALAAPAERVAAQLTHAAAAVEKCVCWEYPYFAGNVQGGKELSKWLFQ